MARTTAVLASAAICCLLITGSHGYIRVNNGVFVDDDCNEFTFSGYNTWQAVESAVNVCCGGYSALVGQFKAAAQNGFRVVRMFGFPVQRGFNLQTSAGVFNELAFKGLDIAVAEAAKANLHLVVALMNNWNYNPLQTDWKCGFTNWTTTALGCDDFYTDPNAIQLYKNYVKTVLTRVNTVTGVVYGNDPTIMAWNLMNEPRSDLPSGPSDIQSWIATVAPYVKSMAPNQLVTVGEDGFYQKDNCQSNTVNPVPNNSPGIGSGWASSWPVSTGNDFLPNHMVDGIDYASIHMWPDNWGRTDPAFGQTWLAAHIADTQYLGKPLVLEEFGKTRGGYLPDDKYQGPTAQYDYYKQTYDAAAQSITAGTGLKGIMFWRWAGIDPTANVQGFDEAATITSNSTIFQNILVPFSRNLVAQNANPKKVAACQPIVGAPTIASTAAAAAAAPLPAANAPLAAQAADANSTAIAAVAAAPLPAAVGAPLPAAATAAGNASSASGAPTAAGGRRRLRQAGAVAAPVQPEAAVAPAAAAPQALAPGAAKPLNYVGKSTFSTPAGINAANINSKVVCTQR